MDGAGTQGKRDQAGQAGFQSRKTTCLSKRDKSSAGAFMFSIIIDYQTIIFFSFISFLKRFLSN
jgi:hypothetical protein